VSEAGATGPYRQLVALLEQQLQLAQAGNLEALAALEATWQRLADSLPDTPPAEAEATLRRAAVLLSETGKRLGELQRRLEGEVRESRTRRLLNGLYRRGDHGQGRRVDRHA
jgi:phytoene dehydrogenase-like protein